VTSSPPEPVEDPEMNEAVTEQRHEEVERSSAVGDSDADRWQTLSGPPALSGRYYEPGTAEAVALKTQSVSHWLGRCSLR